jgi:hypothetical protein
MYVLYGELFNSSSPPHTIARKAEVEEEKEEAGDAELQILLKMEGKTHP